VEIGYRAFLLPPQPLLYAGYRLAVWAGLALSLYSLVRLTAAARLGTARHGTAWLATAWLAVAIWGQILLCALGDFGEGARFWVSIVPLLTLAAAPAVKPVEDLPAPPG
jgi:hypothetical protein